MTAGTLTMCTCGQGMVRRRGATVCLHCDSPCAIKACSECKRLGVKK